MSLFYRSTRDDSVRVTASQAILKGLAPDGGLFGRDWAEVRQRICKHQPG